MAKPIGRENIALNIFVKNRVFLDSAFFCWPAKQRIAREKKISASDMEDFFSFRKKSFVNKFSTEKMPRGKQ